MCFFFSYFLAYKRKIRCWFIASQVGTDSWNLSVGRLYAAPLATIRFFFSSPTWTKNQSPFIYRRLILFYSPTYYFSSLFFSRNTHTHRANVSTPTYAEGLVNTLDCTGPERWCTDTLLAVGWGIHTAAESGGRSATTGGKYNREKGGSLDAGTERNKKKKKEGDGKKNKILSLGINK